MAAIGKGNRENNSPPCWLLSVFTRPRPLAAHHDGHEDRRSWMDSCDLLLEFTKTGQRRAQRGAGHLKDPFERPIEFQDQKNRTGDR